MIKKTNYILRLLAGRIERISENHWNVIYHDVL